jgi:hypothetical protein
VWRGKEFLHNKSSIIVLDQTSSILPESSAVNSPQASTALERALSSLH